MLKTFRCCGGTEKPTSDTDGAKENCSQQTGSN